MMAASRTSWVIVEVPDKNVPARDHEAALLASTMSEKEKIQLDGNRPATLHNGAVSTDFPTLRDAIIAWHRPPA